MYITKKCCHFTGHKKLTIIINKYPLISTVCDTINIIWNYCGIFVSRHHHIKIFDSLTYLPGDGDLEFI